MLACFTRIQDFLLLKPWPGAKESTTTSCVPASFEAKDNAHDSSIELHVRDSPLVETDIAKRRSVIELSDVSIAPTSDAEPVLHGVNLHIVTSTLTVVVGPVASGKTTLLRALMGEAHIIGSATGLRGTSTGYCDQVSWLRNISIRDNIIGSSEFDNTWYNTVLSSCMLHEDLRQISDGDQALAGSDGASLSGGQKQRVVC